MDGLWQHSLCRFVRELGRRAAHRPNLGERPLRIRDLGLLFGRRLIGFGFRLRIHPNVWLRGLLVNVRLLGNLSELLVVLQNIIE